MGHRQLIGTWFILAATLLSAGSENLFAETTTAVTARVTPVAPDLGKTSPPTADQVIEKLLAGNQRYVTGNLKNARRSPDDFQNVAEAQFPLAAIVACADSRVAPELLFDMGVGDLFVVRAAGNVVDGTGVTIKGSIEYAIAELNVPLVIVLGHSNCGAVQAAITHMEDNDPLPGAIDGLVKLIEPAVKESRNQSGNELANATRANVRIGVKKLKGLQPILAPRVEDGSVKVIGGVYDLHTGKVELLP
jgi:carbonic anhydrase